MAYRSLTDKSLNIPCDYISLNFSYQSFKKFFFILHICILSFLSIGNSQSDSLNTTTQILHGAYGIDFGSREKDVIDIMENKFNSRPFRTLDRQNYKILEFRKVNVDKKRIDRLRTLIHPEEGVFWIEEEIYLRWNFQKPERDNWEVHRKRIDRVINRLRKQYGNETFLEEPDIGKRFSAGSSGEENDFVTATWQFLDDRWIHVIYEPQDWSLMPELYKIIVIYRDSARDNRFMPTKIR